MISDRTRDGNAVLRANLRTARELSAKFRSGVDDLSRIQYVRGMIDGANMIACLWLDPDPLFIRAVENECRFLLGAYLK
jgi:hypothetical protein